MASISHLKMGLTGDNTEWTRGKLAIDADTVSGNFKDDFNALLNFEGKPETGQLQSLTFNAQRTDLTTKVTENLLNGSVNKSQIFHDSTDFEVLCQSKDKKA